MPANQHNPDYAVPPGWVLEEYLEVRGLSQDELARLCDCSSEQISEIFTNFAPLSPALALQFERVLGLSAEIWLGIEANYRLRESHSIE